MKKMNSFLFFFVVLGVSTTILTISAAYAQKVSTMDVPEWGSFIPLRGGLVVAANRVNNTLDLLDVDANVTVTSVQLNNAPGAIDIDQSTSTFFVSLYPATFLARVNILSGGIKYIQTPCKPLDVKVGSNNFYVLCAGNVLVMDLINHAVKSQVTVDSLANVISVYKDSFFVVGLAGYSTTIGVYRFQNTQTGWLRTDSGIESDNGNSLVISPDGAHLEMVAGGGNGGGYSILDIDSQNFTTIYGSFVTGAYPVGGAYTPDMRLFVSSNYDNFLVFDAANHNVVLRLPIPKNSPYFIMRSIRVGTGDRFYAYATTTPSGTGVGYLL